MKVELLVDSPTGLGPAVLAQSADPGHCSSFALICPECGRVWGRVRLRGNWFALVRRCREHANEWHIGGSFFQEFDWEPGDLEDFLLVHPALAEHEFTVTMAWAGGLLPATTLSEVV